ncbi:hypothetical protein [Longibacter sp.]|jgi:hypothetical protein|uniref:hypothetical protein n=1 Tax=Longibacter sp. TaxID=2045415 RepID=UPI003EBD88E7
MKPYATSRSASPVHFLRTASPATSLSPTVREATAFYAPPYDDDLDDAFLWNLVKYLGPVSDLHLTRSGSASLFIIETPARTQQHPDLGGRRRIGFLLRSDAVGEANAPSSIDADALRRLDVHEVYVLREADVTHRLPDVLFIISRWVDGLFSERGRTNLERLATGAAHDVSMHPSDDRVCLSYSDEAPAASLRLDAPVAVPAEVVVCRHRLRRRPGTNRPQRGVPPRRRYRRSA